MQNNVEYACAMSWSQEIIDPNAGSGLDLRAVSVLILEKTELMRETLAGVLAGLGIKDIRSTGDAEHAFELYHDRPADLVFSDWAPDLDGMDFLLKIRRHPDTPCAFAPVIMVTANTEPRHVITARDTGMTEFVAKPFTARRIYSRVWEAVQRQRTFIRNATFFGPDRRRRAQQVEGVERRRTVH